MTPEERDRLIADALDRAVIGAAEVPLYRTMLTNAPAETKRLLQTLTGVPAVQTDTDRAVAAALRGGQEVEVARLTSTAASTRLAATADHRYEHYRAAATGAAAPARQVAGPPTPTVTASGIPVSELGAVPNSFARQAIADEPDLATAYRLLQDYSGERGELAAMVDIDSGTGRIAQLVAQARRDANAERDRAHAAYLTSRGVGGPPALTAEAIAHDTQRRAEAAAQHARLDELDRRRQQH